MKPGNERRIRCRCARDTGRPDRRVDDDRGIDSHRLANATRRRPGVAHVAGRLDGHGVRGATDFSRVAAITGTIVMAAAPAGAAFMGLAIGAIAGAIAAQQRRDEYE